MASDIKLLPCPFCGGEAYIKNCSNGYSSSMFTKMAEVGCSECEIYLSGESSFEVSESMNINVLEDGIGEMINRWNTRKPMDRIVEELEQAESVKCYGSRNSGNYMIPLADAIEIVKAGGGE